MSRSCLLLAATALAAAIEVEPSKLACADAAPLDPGAIELGVGASWTGAHRAFDSEGRLQDRGGRFRDRRLGLGLTCGLADDLDAGIGAGWARVDDAAADPDHGSGPTDIGIGAKWCFWRQEDDDSAWAVALLPAIAVPIGRNQDPEAGIPTASRCWTAGLVLAASGNAGPVALNADAGYAHSCGSRDFRGGVVGTLSADVAAGLQLDDAFQPEIDLSWTRGLVEGTDDSWQLAVTAGVQITLPSGRLGLGVQRVVAGSGADATTALIADLAIAIE